MDYSVAILTKTENELRATYIHNNVSRYSQKAECITIAADYVFATLQISTDTVAALAGITGVQLVRTVADRYYDSQTKVRVRRHPYCNSLTVQKTLAAFANTGAIEQFDATLHDLISGANAVFTANTGIGLEAFLHGRPVVVTGECDYSYAAASCASSVA